MPDFRHHGEVKQAGRQTARVRHDAPAHGGCEQMSAGPTMKYKIRCRLCVSKHDAPAQSGSEQMSARNYHRCEHVTKNNNELKSSRSQNSRDKSAKNKKGE